MKVDISANCPCCEFKTFDQNSRGNYEVCPVCFWEDDPSQEADPNYEGGANGVSLNQARANYRKCGAIKYELMRYVRAPSDKEKM